MRFLFIPLALAACLLTSCQLSDDSCDDAPEYSICSEKPAEPGTMTCTETHESWIYDESEGTCEKLRYNGCNTIGFQTEVECMKCDCHRLE